MEFTTSFQGRPDAAQAAAVTVETSPIKSVDHESGTTTTTSISAKSSAETPQMANGRSSLEGTDTKITSEHCQELFDNGFVVIDNFLDAQHASNLLEELKWLAQQSPPLMKPNRTHFSSPSDPSKHFLFDKPGIFEVDLHQPEIRQLEAMPLMRQLFDMTGEGDCVLSTLRNHLPSWNLRSGDSARTIKLQWNTGEGGCFPCHYDNPGPGSNRAITCVLYLNKDWTGDRGDGGEITLLPFLKQPVRVAPKMNRCVAFRSNGVLHRTERSWHERFCLTIWIDGDGTNRLEDSQLRLPRNALANDAIEARRMLSGSNPVQRALSRAVYREEYESSLAESMAGAPGRIEMTEAHHAHLRAVSSNPPLAALVDVLRQFKHDADDALHVF